MERPWQDERNLRELYWGEGMSQPEIAEAMGCSRSTIIRWFSRHDIETRDSTEIGREGGGDHSDRETPWRNEEKLRQKYEVEGKGMKPIADDWDTSRETISRWLDNHDIEKKKATEYYGGGSRSVFDGCYQVLNGYTKLAESGGERASVYVHQLTAIAYGADPHSIFSDGDYHVHHKNGVRWDNRPQNLEVVTPKEHRNRHTEPKSHESLVLS